MADILETVKERNAAVEYDDPYAGAPFFSDETMSAKIEKSPVLIMKKPIDNDEFQSNLKKEGRAESMDTSLESSSFEHPEMNSSAISEEKPDETVSDTKCLTDSSDMTSEKESANIEPPVDVCYENFLNISDVCIAENNENELHIKEALADISGEGKKRLSFHSEPGQEEVHDYDDPDTAIYDAPWDLGAIQKGLEEKLMINKNYTQESGAFRSDGIPRLVTQGQRDLGVLPSSLSKIKTPSAAINHQNRNSPETSDDSLKSKSFSGSRHSLKKGSPSRKPDVVAPGAAEFSRSGFAPMSYLNRPLPTCPAPQVQLQQPFMQVHPHQSFSSNSLIATEHQLLHHPLQRRGIPVMGGGSVGRGMQQPQKIVGAPAPQADWRPLEDYDSPWDNKQRDLISTFNQEPSSLRSSMKKSNHPIVPLVLHASLAEKIESRLPLEQEWWYHGPITRQEAEKRLANEREGSYLIRNSESNRLDYSLSIKSSFGCIHLKIVTNNDGRFILGQFSQPFVSVAQMIQHYTVNKLPIKGAEHMSLTFPVGH